MLFLLTVLTMEALVLAVSGLVECIVVLAINASDIIFSRLGRGCPKLCWLSMGL